jgi:surface polysaccharide O-acyltransferase-like enzyme
MEQIEKKGTRCAGRDITLDLLRIFSCACIILLHESGHLLWTSGYNLMIQAIVRPCLWVFVMISGYFVLSRPIKKIGRFYYKNIVYLIIPLFIYSAFYQVYMNREQIHGIGDVFRSIHFKSILAGDIFGHFWFVYTLVSIYFLAPFLQRLLQNLNGKQTAGLLLFLFICIGIKPILEQYGLKIGIDVPFNNATMTFYFILGYALRLVDLHKYRVPIFVLGVVNIPALFFANRVPQLVGNLYTGSLQMVVGAVFYFALFQELFAPLNTRAPKWLSTAIYFVSKRTYGIYLLHLMILQVISKYFTHTPENKYYLVLVKTVLIFLIALVGATAIDFVLVRPVQWVYDKLIQGVGKGAGFIKGRWNGRRTEKTN